MNVIVDTSVWSLALRRAAPRRTAPVAELMNLIKEGRVVMLGPIRQEILSGVRAREQFHTLRDRFRAFPDLLLTHLDYEDAAEAFTSCRKKGIQGSSTDFLICAAAMRRGLAILTTDKDFERFRKVLPFDEHPIRD